MFQLLVGLMIRNTEKTVKEFEAVGGEFKRYQKRKWYFWKEDLCSFKDEEKVLTLREVYDVEKNTDVVNWMWKIINDTKAEATA